MWNNESLKIKVAVLYNLIDVTIYQCTILSDVSCSGSSGSGSSQSPAGPSSGAIPRGRQGRRHSVQVNINNKIQTAPIIVKVSSLSRDMDRLKLAEAAGAKAQEPSKEKMSEARKKELRKMSQKRRSSKQSKYWLQIVVHGLVFAQPRSLTH